jgi:hypothetical protein
MRALDEQRALRRRIKEIDLRIVANARTAALEGIDQRNQWDQLITERVLLAKRLATLMDNASLRLAIASLPLAILGVLLVSRPFRFGWAAVIGFSAGLISGIYFSVIRDRSRSRDLDLAYSTMFQNLD